MKQLARYARYKRTFVDQARQELLHLEGQRDYYLNIIHQYDYQMVQERSVAAADPRQWNEWGRYAQKVRLYQRQLQDKLKGLNKDIQVARAKLMEAYQEVKAYDIVLERFKQQHLIAQERHEEAEMEDRLNWRHSGK